MFLAQILKKIKITIFIEIFVLLSLINNLFIKNYTQ